MMHSLTAINTNVILVLKWKFGIAKKKSEDWNKDGEKEQNIEEEYGI